MESLFLVVTLAPFQEVASDVIKMPNAQRQDCLIRSHCIPSDRLEAPALRDAIPAAVSRWV